MTKTQFPEIKSKIIEELEKLKTEITTLEELCRPIEPQCALGDLARFELMNEQVVYEKSLKEALIRRNRFEYALRKVDRDDFGICIECEEKIAFERLLILPESTHCMECASRLNRNR